MGLGLLRKASLYRERFLNRPKKGLFKRALEYLEKKELNYPEIKEKEELNSNLIEDTSFLSEHSLIEEKDSNIKDIDTVFDEKYENIDFEFTDEDKAESIKEIKQNNELKEIDPEELQMELMEDLSKIEDITEPEIVTEETEEAELLEETSILDSEMPDDLLEEDLLSKKEEEIKEEESEKEIIDEVLEIEEIKDIDDNIDKKEINEVKQEKILEEIEKNNLNEVTKSINFNNEVLPKDKDFNKRYYYNLINKISKDFAKLVINVDSYKDFLNIISNNFNISKCALLVFSPQKQKFVCWHAKNLDQESIEKLNFDLDFGDIYKSIAKERSYFILPNNSQFENIDSLLSANDKNNSDFQLWTPFIFSARIIGILLSIQMYDRSIPVVDFIDSLEIIGRLNGSLLYNLFQHYNLSLQKKNQEIDNRSDLEEIDEEQKKSVDLEIADKLNNTDNKNIGINEIPLDEIFPQKYHKLISFTEQKLKENSATFISFICIKLTNKEEIEQNVPNFKAYTFLSDIQFIGMNVAGTNSFLQLYEDISMFIILPEVKKSVAINTAMVIIDEIKMMFNEIFGSLSLNFKYLVLSIPEDSNNYIEIFSKLINL